MIDSTSSLRIMAHCRLYSRVSGAAAVLVGGSVLAGWRLRNEFLKSVFPGLVAMNPATAVAFILAGCALVTLNMPSVQGPAARGRRFAQACALIVVVMACLRLAGYLCGWDIGMDRWLFASALESSATGVPNRMAPNTAANFLLVGCSLLLIGTGQARLLLPAQLLAAVAAGVALLALLGYAYGARQLYGIALFIPMAVNTAFTFLLVATGLLCVGPDGGAMRLFTGASAAGQTARRLLPVAVAAPAAIGWLRLRGQAAGFYGTEVGTSLMATAIVLAFTAVIYWNARLLHRMELDRDEAAEALRKAYEDLELRVRERTAELARANEGLRREMGEKAQLQAQLIQSQKMEAVGRLAGGVAHDFNNILTAIEGYSHFLLGSLAPDDQRREDVEEIKKAGERASSLTRQLLAFSRQQVLQPKVLDCNALVADLEKMLRRIIGEDVELATIPAPAPGLIKADPGQIEQVIMNLVVNAKDAMPKGGKIAIETANVEIGEDYARMHLQVRAGSYVMLSVSDSGTGMDSNTLSHLFEPFFTTKEQGKGTGLGLATVYGIVKQSGGGIYVYSEPGHGAVFRVYFPRVPDASALEGARPVLARPSGGSETILVVEDDEAVRKFIQRALRERGYTVLTAQDPAQAVLLCERHESPIHMLLTDVIMPQMHGPELAERLARLHPESKVVYMSGYTDSTVVHRDLVGRGASFLQKPLGPELLARKVRAVLDGAS